MICSSYSAMEKAAAPPVGIGIELVGILVVRIEDDPRQPASHHIWFQAPRLHISLKMTTNHVNPAQLRQHAMASSLWPQQPTLSEASPSSLGACKSPDKLVGGFGADNFPAAASCRNGNNDTK